MYKIWTQRRHLILASSLSVSRESGTQISEVVCVDTARFTVSAEGNFANVIDAAMGLSVRSSHSIASDDDSFTLDNGIE